MTSDSLHGKVVKEIIFNHVTEKAISLSLSSSPPLFSKLLPMISTGAQM